MKASLSRRLGSAVASLSLLAVGVALAARPAAAQQQQPTQQTGHRYFVLVPNLTPAAGVKDDFGKKTAEDMRKLINGLDRYQPVDPRQMKNAAKKYKLNSDKLTCIQARQLAVQEGWQLVMCGSYTGAGQTKAQFIGAKNGDTFDVDAFAAQTPDQAAKHIFDQFRNYVDQLGMTVYCLDYLSSQQYASALQNCDKALAINPKSVSANYGRARALMKMDSLAPALVSLQAALKQSPTNQDVLLTAGIVATKLNQEQVARKYFRDYLQLNPGNVDVRLSVATKMNNAGDPVGAYKFAEEGLQAEPNNPTLLEYAGHYALAAAQAAEQQPADGAGVDSAKVKQYYDDALSSYQKVFAIKGDSADSQMLRNMVVVLTKLDRNQQAVQLGAKIVAVKPNDAGVWMAYAGALNQVGRVEDAIKAADKAVSINPNIPDAYSLEGQWVLQTGNLDRAKQIFDKALARQTNPQSKARLSDQFANSIFAYGYNDKYKKGQKDAAASFFRACLDYATTEQTKAMASFWIGYPLYEQAVTVQKPGTVAAAKKALPMFQDALKYFQASGPYAKTQKGVPLQKLIAACNRYIQIQQLLMKRG